MDGHIPATTHMRQGCTSVMLQHQSHLPVLQGDVAQGPHHRRAKGHGEGELAGSCKQPHCWCRQSSAGSAAPLASCAAQPTPKCGTSLPPIPSLCSIHHPPFLLLYHPLCPASLQPCTHALFIPALHAAMQGHQPSFSGSNGCVTTGWCAVLLAGRQAKRIRHCPAWPCLSARLYCICSIVAADR